MRLIFVALAVTLAVAPAPSTGAHAAEIGVFANPLGKRGHPLDLRETVDDSWERFRQDCYNRKGTLVHGRAAILLRGPIEVGDASRFVEAAAPFAGRDGPDEVRCPDAVVFLDSTGGSVLEGIRLGRAIAERGFATVVAPGMACLSACMFAFAGGSYLGGDIPNMVVFPGGRLGLHQPQFELDDRQREILAAAPDAAALAYRLAGSQWREIYDFLVNDRRNVYLLQRLIESPPQRDRFEHLDTFEELYLARIRLVSSDPAAPARTGPRLLTPDVVRHLCAIFEIRNGSQEDFAQAYATRLDETVIVGLRGSEQFCWVPDTDGDDVRVCLFNNAFFWDTDGGPAYLAQWAIGAMGFYPIDMFAEDMFDAFPVAGTSTRASKRAVEAFLRRHEEGRLCDRFERFDVATLQALSRSMWISADCPAATRLCETDRSLAENAGLR